MFFKRIGPLIAHQPGPKCIDSWVVLLPKPSSQNNLILSRNKITFSTYRLCFVCGYWAIFRYRRTASVILIFKKDTHKNIFDTLCF